jgi:hypothetical protein
MSRIIPPGGRLTLVQGQPLMSADVTSTVLWFAPYDGGASYPNLDATLTWQDVSYTASHIDPVGASVSCTNLVAGSSYDVFGLAGGSIGFGPAWVAPDDASRRLLRYDGIKVNSVPLAIGGVTVPQYQATYLGSVHCSVGGQLTAHFSNGQDRKFEVWTAYGCNQTEIVLKVVDALASGVWVPTNEYKNQNWVPFNNDPTNRATPFTGEQTPVDVMYHQNMFINSGLGGPSGLLAQIGWDGVAVGFTEVNSSDQQNMASALGGSAHYVNPTSNGPHTATMLCAAANTPTSVEFSGVAGTANPDYTESNQVMFVRYWG